ncbi:MAG: endolytic transglycosylase MltG [Candidatus Saccharimonadales bacterium]
MDIRPPRKRPSTRLAVPVRTQQPRSVDIEHRLSASVAEPLLEKRAVSFEIKKRADRKRLFILLSGLVLIMIGLLVGGYFWYQQALTPVSSNTNAPQVIVKIETGTTLNEIRDILYEDELIRSKLAFDIYVRLSGQSGLQAGSYRFTATESLPEIIQHLTSGHVESFTIMFYPGAVLRDTTDKPEEQKTDISTVLRRAGYSQREIDEALAKTYDSPLFADKPTEADLEGYIYGQTYSFAEGTTVEQILERTFDEMYAVIEENDLVAKYKTQELSLYQGITLASIIQREVPDATEKDRSDQKQVAQVFYRRLSKGMPLGSDVTYHYAADKMGIARHFNLDSPYNTRKVVGLPPGPISTPGESALIAAGNPASGDYLFFLSGDDDKTYFAHTDVEHARNIAEHCKEKCLLP